LADTKISLLTTDSAPHRSLDFAPTYDASALATKKVALRDFGAYTIDAMCASASPADATTYYFGSFPSAAPTTTEGVRRLYIPRTGIITQALVHAINTGTAGSGESGSLYVRKSVTTDTLITSAFTTNAQFILITAINVSVSATEFVEIKWVTPTYATNPTGVFIHVALFVE
jgi:hypothetical protein